MKQNSKEDYKMRKLFTLIFAGFFLLFFSLPAFAQLDESCVIAILNRTTDVQFDGSWTLPNVPSNMGQVRARATCVEGGITRAGQSDFFTVVQNGITDVGEIKFDEDYQQVPSDLALSSDKNPLTAEGETAQISVIATYPDSSTADVSAASSGTVYTSTNPAIATVNKNGLVTAAASGTVIISASNEALLSSISISVNLTGDSDGDGIPDDFELANGLNPNNPIDALEDPDGDGLTNKQEYDLGTGLSDSDSDDDGINDGEEVTEGEDGYITNPLLADSDGDGISDGLETSTGSNPTDSGSYNLADALLSVEVTPSNFVMVFNTIMTEASRQLTVTGTLIDGNTLDLTSESLGTNYDSSDLDVVNFGLDDGLVFAGDNGTATITATNNGFSDTAVVTVTTFTPTALSYVQFPGGSYANNVDVEGGYAFVAAGAGGLYVVDVSNPESLSVETSLDTPGTAIDVKISDNKAFIADGSSGLRIIDVSTPTAPTSLGFIDTDGIAQDLVVVGDLVFIADGSNGLVIVNVSDPANPAILSSEDTPGTAKGVDVDMQEEVAVIADGNTVQVIDISNLSDPSILGSVGVSSTKDLVVRDGYAYVAAYSGGLKVVDYSTTPGSPTVVGNTGGVIACRDIALSDQFALFAEQLFPNAVPIFNISDPENPVFNSIVNFSPLGDYAGTGIDINYQYFYFTSQYYVVSSDYGSTGSTRLFTGQYRMLQDTGTEAPTVNITSPSDNGELIEGSVVTLAAEATDDVFVASVSFVVNDEIVFTDTSEPFQYAYTVPINITELYINAEAIDLAGNIGVADDVMVNVIPDPVPEVTITSPADGDTYIEGDDLPISATATDNTSVSQLDLLVDGVVVFTETQTLDDNLALGMPATASSTYSSYSPSRANDNSTSSFWYASGYAPQWWEVDLEEEFTIATVEVIPRYTGNATYEVWVYDDNGANTLAHTFSGSFTNGQTLSHNFSTPVQHVRRIRINAVSSPTWVSLYEVRAFGYLQSFEASLTHTVPLGIDSLIVGARATDSIGKVGTAEVTINVLPDPAPEVTLTSPANGADIIEGSTINVTADATDNTGVTQVEFLIDSTVEFTDTTAPFGYNYTVPIDTAGTSIAIGAIATDTIGKTSTAEDVSINIIPDPLTTVIGRVIDTEDNPVSGAIVTTNGGASSTTGPDGTFSITDVRTVLGDIVVSASITIAGNLFIGASAAIPPVLSGTTDVGDIMAIEGNLIDMRVTNDPEESDQPVIALDSLGNIHLAWSESRDDNYEIYYKMLNMNGDVLIDDTRLTFDSANSRRPSIAMDSTDKIHIVWHDQRLGDTEVFYTQINSALDDQNGDAALDETIRVVDDQLLSLDDSMYSMTPRIAIDNSNSVHVVWADDWEKIFYMRLNSNGTTAVAPTAIFSGGNFWRSTPAIAADSQGNAHVAWNDYYAGEIPEGPLVSNTKSIIWLYIANLMDYLKDLWGDTIATAAIEIGEASYEVFYKMIDGNGNTLIDTTLMTSVDGANSKWQTILVGNDDKPYIIWQDQRGIQPEIYIMKIDPSLDDRNGDSADSSVIKVLEDTPLTPDDGAKSNHPAAAIDSNNNIYVTWYENWASWEGGDLHYRLFDHTGTPLIEAVSISSSAVTETAWTLGFIVPNKTTNRVFVTWTDRRDNNSEIYLRSVFISRAPTTVEGRVVKEDGEAVSGANITISAEGTYYSAITAIDGTFSVSGVSTILSGNVTASARIRIGDDRFVGSSNSVQIIPGSSTNLGDIIVILTPSQPLAYIAGGSPEELSNTFDSMIVPEIPPLSSFVPGGSGVIFTGDYLMIGVNAQGSLIYSGVGLRFSSSNDVLYIGTDRDVYGFRFDFEGTHYFGYGGSNNSPNDGNVSIISFDIYQDGILNVARSVTQYGPLQIETITSLRKGDKYVSMEVYLTNTGTAPIENLRFSRSPDFDVNGEFDNSFDVYESPGGGTIISAGNPGQQYFGLAVNEEFTFADGITFANRDPDIFRDRDPNGTYEDYSATFVFSPGTLSPGETIPLSSTDPCSGTGVVKGALTGDNEPYVNTKISITAYCKPPKYKKTTFTDEKGKYSISGVPAGGAVSVVAYDEDGKVIGSGSSVLRNDGDTITINIEYNPEEVNQN